MQSCSSSPSVCDSTLKFLASISSGVSSRPAFASAAARAKMPGGGRGGGRVAPRRRRRARRPCLAIFFGLNRPWLARHLACCFAS